jgi:hypothetical protein
MIRKASALIVAVFVAGFIQATAAHASLNPKGSDTTPPAAVTDLAASDPNIHSVQLTWTAPGDDGHSGRAARYDVRYSASPITEANWEKAIEAGDELYQKPAGKPMLYQANQLKTGATYYFALKTTDSSGNISGLSNVVSATTYVPKPDKVSVSSLDALRDAISKAPSTGRIITLAPKTYHQTKTIDISDKNNITIQGATQNFNDTAIAGPGINNRSLDINFHVIESSYVTFRNLTIEDSYYHAIQVKEGSAYFHADHVKTWDNGESGFKVTDPARYDLGQSDADYGLIENCLIGNTTTGMRNEVEGIDIIAAKGWVIRGNTFTHIKKPLHRVIERFLKADDRMAYAVFAKGNAIGTVIEGNIIKNSAIGMSFGGGGTGRQWFRNNDATYEHRGGIMRNNVIYNMVDAGIYMNKAYDFQVYNNTLANVGQDGAGAIALRSTPPSSGTIRNNLIYMSGAAPVEKHDGRTVIMSNNKTVTTSAIFVDPANGNYHLKSTAKVAIDQGYPLPNAVRFDIDGQARPQGAGWDIGADEYVAPKAEHAQ